MPQFEIGAIVTLKSGSPAMTIVGEGLSRSYCHAWEVTWFVGPTERIQTFDERALSFAPPPESVLEETRHRYAEAQNRLAWFEQQLSGMTGANASIEDNLREIGARLGVVQAEIQPPPAPAKRIDDEDVPF